MKTESINQFEDRPLKELQKKFGFTPANIIVAAGEQIAKARGMRS
jgi:hypothetical protein